MGHSVIIGMGAASLSAAEMIRRYQPSATITMIADDAHGYYSRPGLAYVLTEEIPDAQLFPISRKRWKDLGVRRIQGRVTQLLPGDRQVVLADEQRFAYDTLLLATGSASIPLSVPGSDLDGVVMLDSLDDTRYIARAARRARGRRRRRRHHGDRTRRRAAGAQRTRPLFHAWGALLAQRA